MEDGNRRAPKGRDDGSGRGLYFHDNTVAPEPLRFYDAPQPRKRRFVKNMRRKDLIQKKAELAAEREKPREQRVGQLKLMEDFTPEELEAIMRRSGKR